MYIHGSSKTIVLIRAIRSNNETHFEKKKKLLCLKSQLHLPTLPLVCFCLYDVLYHQHCRCLKILDLDDITIFFGSIELLQMLWCKNKVRLIYFDSLLRFSFFPSFDLILHFFEIFQNGINFIF